MPKDLFQTHVAARMVFHQRLLTPFEQEAKQRGKNTSQSSPTCSYASSFQRNMCAGEEDSASRHHLTHQLQAGHSTFHEKVESECKAYDEELSVPKVVTCPPLSRVDMPFMSMVRRLDERHIFDLTFRLVCFVLCFTYF